MDFFANLSGGYGNIWKAIIRPPRDEYDIDQLGPAEFKLKGKNYKRTDLQVINNRGLTLQCSHFEPVNRVAKQLPCVIYLHGNSSSKLEALHALDVLLSENITLFCFDFAGCGKSEGDYISLGWYERDDVDSVIAFLRNTGTVSTVGLWGRSMGAVSALMHSDRDPTIAGVVADSSFSDLKILSEELMKNHTKIPKIILSGVMGQIKKTVESKAKFNMDDLVPLKHVGSSFMPALFISGKKDDYIDPHHTKDLYEKYAGDKKLILVDGNHHSPRPKFLLDSIAIFFHNTLLVEQLPEDPSRYLSLEDSIKESKAQKLKISEDEDGYLEIDVELLKSKVVPKDYDMRKFIGPGDEREFVKALEASMRMNPKIENREEARSEKKVQEEEKKDDEFEKKSPVSEQEVPVKKNSLLKEKLESEIQDVCESVVMINPPKKEEKENEVVQESEEMKANNPAIEEKRKSPMKYKEIENLNKEEKIESQKEMRKVAVEVIGNNLQETVILMKGSNEQKKEKEEIPEEIIQQSMIIITNPESKKEIEANLLKDKNVEKDNLQNSCHIIEEEKEPGSQSFQMSQDMEVDIQASMIIIKSQGKEKEEPKEKQANDDYEIIE